MKGGIYMEKKKNFTPIIVMLIVLSIVAIGFGVYNSKNCGVISNALGLAPSTGCVNPFSSVTLNVGDNVCLRNIDSGTIAHLGACGTGSHPNDKTLVVSAWNVCEWVRKIDIQMNPMLVCSNLCIDGGVQESITRTVTSCTVTRTLTCLPQSGAGDDGGE